MFPLCKCRISNLYQFRDYFLHFYILATFAPKNICEDKDPLYCGFQMKKPNNQCVFGSKTVRKRMSTDCRKLCKMCKKTGDCYDENSLCPFYAETSKHCTDKKSRYHTFMLEKCKFSCGLCKD